MTNGSGTMASASPPRLSQPGGELSILTTPSPSKTSTPVSRSSESLLSLSSIAFASAVGCREVSQAVADQPVERYRDGLDGVGVMSHDQVCAQVDRQIGKPHAPSVGLSAYPQ